MKRDKAAAAAKTRPEWRSCRETNEGRRRQRQARAAQNGDHAGRQMKGDKAAAASRPFDDFGDQQPSH